MTLNIYIGHPTLITHPQIRLLDATTQEKLKGNFISKRCG
jgi:hypothetical protein